MQAPIAPPGALPAVTDEDLCRLALSALADGEARDDEVARGCEAWHADAEVRATWHAYQLIGDVLRSEDLVSAGAHDAAFLAGLRERLAQEPVVVAPAPAVAAGPSRRARRSVWRVSVALAAGVAAVAGVVVVVQPSVPGAGTVGAEFAAAAAPDGAVLPVAATAPSRAQMLRDARVDEYLRAHREALAGSPAALPGGAMRNVDFHLPQR